MCASSHQHFSPAPCCRRYARCLLELTASLSAIEKAFDEPRRTARHRTLLLVEEQAIDLGDEPSSATGLLSTPDVLPIVCARLMVPGSAALLGQLLERQLPPLVPADVQRLQEWQVEEGGNEGAGSSGSVAAAGAVRFTPEAAVLQARALAGRRCADLRCGDLSHSISISTGGSPMRGKRCSACHAVRYCSAECQRADWRALAASSGD